VSLYKLIFAWRKVKSGANGDRMPFIRIDDRKIAIKKFIFSLYSWEGDRVWSDGAGMNQGERKRRKKGDVC
jgi:hypothetical protein